MIYRSTGYIKDSQSYVHVIDILQEIEKTEIVLQRDTLFIESVLIPPKLFPNPFDHPFPSLLSESRVSDQKVREFRFFDFTGYWVRFLPFELSIDSNI